MNALFFVVLCVLFGGIICFCLGRLIEEVIREVRPDWLLTGNHHYQVHEQTQIPRVKFIPKRPSVNTALTGQKRTGIVRPVIVTLVVIGSLFSNFSKGQDRCVLISGISHFAATQFMEEGRLKFWPVWGRTGNDNIISREKLFGQEITSKDPVFEAIPEEIWPLWVRTGNEWLIKRRMMLFRNYT